MPPTLPVTHINGSSHPVFLFMNNVETVLFAKKVRTVTLCTFIQVAWSYHIQSGFIWTVKMEWWHFIFGYISNILAWIEQQFLLLNPFNDNMHCELMSMFIQKMQTNVEMSTRHMVAWKMATSTRGALPNFITVYCNFIMAKCSQSLYTVSRPYYWNKKDVVN